MMPPVAILAGGLATRLRPLTVSVPKSLVEVAGRPFIAWQLDYLRDQGNLKHVVATTAPLPQDSRQREIEAYALQADPALVQHLLRESCRRKS
jgi:NDP-sugar pyrophosphorylase family protein